MIFPKTQKKKLSPWDPNTDKFKIYSACLTEEKYLQSHFSDAASLAMKSNSGEK